MCLCPLPYLLPFAFSLCPLPYPSQIRQKAQIQTRGSVCVSVPFALSTALCLLYHKCRSASFSLSIRLPVCLCMSASFHSLLCAWTRALSLLSRCWLASACILCVLSRRSPVSLPRRIASILLHCACLSVSLVNLVSVAFLIYQNPSSSY